ncbi:MAG: hypothetical protein LBD68_01585 [Zoogloeaceae bacterium]|jgi:hypothetical protein|nr:hypothetical protein [Zoogloeaceae bacterium]
MKYSLFHSIALAALALTLALLAAPSSAQTAAETPAAAPVREENIDLLKLVPGARMPEGQRAIFEPRVVRFTAKLARMPAPQKTDYLKKVMSMMGFNNPPAVSQSVALEYGGDRPLAAYVEEQAAARIAREAKTGERYNFSALYVYNNRFGPALIVTSFSQ